jgi:hypothetical protein
MDKTQEVKEITRNFKAEAIERVGELEDGRAYEFVVEDDHLILNLDGEQFKVRGNKRLYVEQLKAKKVRKSSGDVKPDFIETVCDHCGTTFKLSKFTPYHTTCYDCRKAARKEQGRWMDSDRITKVCEVTGKEFTTSKFTPYITVSPEGRKILAEREAKAEPVAAIDMATGEVVDLKK